MSDKATDRDLAYKAWSKLRKAINIQYYIGQKDFHAIEIALKQPASMPKRVVKKKELSK